MRCSPSRPLFWPSFSSFIRPARIIATLCTAAALALLLGGCSALRIAYSTAPDVTYWWLDGYIDFTGDQKAKAHQAIGDWFAWNRRTQLPDYADLLVRARAELLADTTPARVCAWQGELTTRARVAFGRIAPAAADIMLTVTTQQVQYLTGRYAKFNGNFRDEYLQPDRLDRARANLKRTVDRAEELYGRLDDGQVEMIAEWLPRSPFDADVWFAERQQRQQAVLQTLRRVRSENATREQALAALQTYAEQLERSPRADYRRYAESLQEFNCAFVARLQNSTTPRQRRKAADKLAGWEGDLRALAAATDKPSRGGGGNGP